MPLNNDWRKSSKSGSSGDCVSVRRNGDAIEVRDDKNPDGPILRFTHSEWEAFVGGAKDNEFDL